MLKMNLAVDLFHKFVLKSPRPFPRSNFEAAQPPILIDNGVAVLENEKIERHIMKNIPGGHNLFISDNVR